jgi:tetratricopeptide (TPR) repeat protein
MSYNLMGYVILQYHEDIGYEVNADEFYDQASIMKGGAASAAEPDASATEAILSQVTILIKDGRAEDAVFLLRDKVRGRPSDRLLSERYYNLLKITQRTSEMLPHGIAHLDLLAEANEKAAACELYKECLALDPQFTPNPEAFFKIAGWCTDNGDIKGGMSALARFVKTAPEHPLAPKAYFLFGKNLHEKLKDAVRAEKVLQDLIRRYPNHDIAHHATEYISRMKKA